MLNLKKLLSTIVVPPALERRYQNVLSLIASLRSTLLVVAGDAIESLPLSMGPLEGDVILAGGERETLEINLGAFTGEFRQKILEEHMNSLLTRVNAEGKALAADVQSICDDIASQAINAYNSLVSGTEPVSAPKLPEEDPTDPTAADETGFGDEEDSLGEEAEEEDTAEAILRVQQPPRRPAIAPKPRR